MSMRRVKLAQIDFLYFSVHKSFGKRLYSLLIFVGNSKCAPHRPSSALSLPWRIGHLKNGLKLSTLNQHTVNKLPHCLIRELPACRGNQSIDSLVQQKSVGLERTNNVAISYTRVKSNRSASKSRLSNLTNIKVNFHDALIKCQLYFLCFFNFLYSNPIKLSGPVITASLVRIIDRPTDNNHRQQCLNPSSTAAATKPATNTPPRVTDHGFPPNIKGITICQLAPASQWAGGAA